MIKVALSPDAILDYDESFLWYAKRSYAAAIGFEQEVEQAIDRVAADGEKSPRFDDTYHYVRLSAYPFLLVFRIEDTIAHIVAVAHTSRSPGYWKKRDQS